MAQRFCSVCAEPVTGRRLKCDDCKAAKPRQRTQAEQREWRVLELKAQGKTFDDIAFEVGYANASGAWKAYKRAMSATASQNLTADQRRELELHRIDVVLNGLWPAASKGDLTAVDRFEKLSKLRAKIEGFSIAPQRSWQQSRGDSAPAAEAEGNNVISPDRLDEMRQRREQRAADRAPGS